MPCYEKDVIISYLKDEMPPEIIDDFDRHIEECDQCAAHLYRCYLELERLADEAFIKRTLALLDRLDGKSVQE